jgi:transposase
VEAAGVSDERNHHASSEHIERRTEAMSRRFCRSALRRVPYVRLYTEEVEFTRAGVSFRSMPCFYCGMPATTDDHVPPVSSVEVLLSSEKIVLEDCLIVPACSRCNRWLGAFPEHRLSRRRRYIKDRFRKKLREGGGGEWIEEEVSELGPNMKREVLSYQQNRDLLHLSLGFSAPLLTSSGRSILSDEPDEVSSYKPKKIEQAHAGIRRVRRSGVGGRPPLQVDLDKVRSVQGMSVTRAAAQIGVSRSSFYRILRKHNLPGTSYCRGRPPTSLDFDAAQELRKRGFSFRQVAAKIGVGKTTLHRFYQRMGIKSRGKVGRPCVRIDLDTVLGLREKGLSIRRIAKQLSVGASTLSRVLQRNGSYDSHR